MNNNHWLMSSEALTALRRLRKRIQAEFGIVLRLSDSGLEHQLAAAKSKSIDGQTRELIASLEKLRGAPFQPADQAPQRLYRGHPVLVEPSRRDIYAMIYGRELALHDPSLRLRKAPLRMYRGQLVVD